MFSKPRNRKFLVYQWFLSYQRLSREVRGYFRNKDFKIFRHLYKKGSIRSELTFFAYSNFLGSIRQVVYGEKTGKNDKNLRNQILFRKSRDDRRKFLFHIRTQNSRTKILMSYCLNFKAPHVHTVSFSNTIKCFNKMSYRSFLYILIYFDWRKNQNNPLN